MTYKISQLPKGYKQTEIGVIPEDWVVKEFGGLSTVRNEKYDSKKLGSHGFCVELEHIGQGSGNLIGFTETSVLSSLKNVFQKDDVLFGRLRAYLRKYWKANRDGVASSEIWPLIANKDITIPEYLFQLVQTRSFMESASEAYGTHMPRSDWNIVKRKRIPLPPTKAEQTAIANVLSDIDELIERLEKLIAKKKAIKQGTMQELLSGKKRLPGFSGEWDARRLDDIFLITAGRDLIKDYYSQISDDSHSFPIYSNSLENKGLYGYTKTPRHKENCITITARGTIGKANAREHEFDAIGRLLILEPTQELDCFFISEYLNNRVFFSIESTGVPQLTAPQASKYLIAYLDIKEQTAIATILSDMDAEIESLEQKRNKYIMLKTGMMQELLTGKTRLV